MGMGGAEGNARYDHALSHGRLEGTKSKGF
jgi:hypothetical protein